MSIINEEIKASSSAKPNQTPKRLWEIWPGKQQFFFKGRVQLGPRGDRCYSLISYGILCLLPGAEIIMTTSYLWVHVTPFIPIVTIYLWLASVLLALLVSFSDPGIIPRRSVFLMFGEVPFEYSSDVLLMNQSKKPRFCKTCEIYRPGHSHHCPLCDCCVQHFDHHCRYLNNCIGNRNYNYFVALVIHLGFLGLNLIDNLILFAFFDEGPANRNERCGFAIHENSIVIVIIVVLGLATLAITVFVCLLCLFHISLFCNGKTTKEVVKGLSRGNKKTCCANTPNLYNPRALVHHTDKPYIVEQSESEVSV